MVNWTATEVRGSELKSKGPGLLPPHNYLLTAKGTGQPAARHFVHLCANAHDLQATIALPTRCSLLFHLGVFLIPSLRPKGGKNFK